MPSGTSYALFVLAALALLVIPGPAVLYVVAQSIAGGRRAGLSSVLGLHFLGLGLVTDSIWAVGAGTAGERLRRSRTFPRIERWVSGSIFVGLGIATRLPRDPTHRSAACGARAVLCAAELGANRTV